MKQAIVVLSIILIGALVVLVVKNASNFATAVAAGGTFVDNSALILSGSAQNAQLATYPGG